MYEQCSVDGGQSTSRRVLGRERELEVVDLEADQLGEEGFKALLGWDPGAQRRWPAQEVVELAHVLVDASIRNEGSHSRQVADIVQREWDAANPGETVINREIGTDPLPPTAWAASLSVATTPDQDRSRSSAHVPEGDC